MKSKRMELPVDLEGVYGVFLKRIIQDVSAYALEARTDRRMDADDQKDLDESDISDEAIVALLALGLTVDTLLDKAKLRKALKRIAKGLDERTKRSLTALLGKAVDLDVTGDLDRWIDNQITVIEALIVTWASEVGAEMIQKGINRASAATAFGMATARQAVEKVQAKGSKAERKGFAEATTAILTLNAALVGANAQAAGANDYIWRASALSPTGTIDQATREWHADLDGSIQNFNDPPIGGGTGPEDLGNPQEGRNCRCLPEIFTA